MKILVLGSGGREHALAWKLAAGRRVERVFCLPGNAGTRDVGENVAADPMDFEAVAAACASRGIDCVFVGPETPLAAGVVDFLEARGIPAVGPKASSARLEASKAFSKAFMAAHGIPTARASEFRDADAFERHLRSLPKGKTVVKKSGLAAGKGVLESEDVETLLAFGKEALRGDAVVVEEFLEGWEVSVFALTDGKGYRLLPACTDFKKAHDGDRGPNTGGMGSICPVPRVDRALMKRIEQETVAPTFAAMDREGLGYRGILYFGLMVTKDGPKVLEYNARFGDPETQVLLPCMEEDLGDVVDAMIHGTLSAASGAASAAALGIVVAAQGYPGSYEKDRLVEPIPRLPEREALVFHASTAVSADGRILTSGGRCFTVVGRGRDLAEASRRAYEAVGAVRFPGAWHRGDIGAKHIGGAR